MGRNKSKEWHLAKGQVYGLARAGLSPVKVSRKMKGSPLKVSDRSIYRWCMEVSKETERINDKPDGRPRTTTEDEDARIVEKVTSEPLKPVTEHKKELEEEGISTSERIMRSRLNEAGYYCYKARKKPWISDKNKEHRLKWATERLNWPLSKWYRVMWTDESKFQLFKPDGNARVWRKEGTAWDVEHIVPTVKHGGGRVLVWGAIGKGGVGKLYQINGIMNKEHYLHKILHRQVKPSFEVRCFR
mgnify:CR=1 FL=1